MILQSIIRTIARKITCAERAEKFARHRARVIEAEKQFDDEIARVVTTCRRIRGETNDNG
jgi:hypothetical protein